jgi:hypothetical protein
LTGLWDSRDEALVVLAEVAPGPLAALEESFSLVDDCAVALYDRKSMWGTVTSVLVVKGRNLAQGLYSLSLDSLAQEGGALLRPLIEVVELLEYLAQDPSRVDSVLDSKPSAGTIAKCIGGSFKPVRDYLNAEASHASFGVDALRHCVEIRDDQPPTLQMQQVFRRTVALRNLHVLFGVVGWLAAEAITCLVIATGEDQPVLAARLEGLRSSGFDEFDSALGAAEA